MAESVLPARAPASEPVAARRRALDVPVCLSIGWLALLVGLSIVGPLLPIPDPNAQDLVSMLAPPGEAHWLGADSLGRDVFARVLYGARISLTVGLGSVAIGLLVGGGLGMVAGYYRGWSEQMVMGFMNVLLAFPALILAITIVANLGGSLLNVTLAIGTLFVPAFARIARANTLVFRRREFVLVAQALGARDPRILLREILPNLVGPMLSYSLVMFAIAVLAEASLGFLGLSVPPPAPSWGSIISNERANLDTAPHVIFVPAAAIFLTVMSLNLLGERAQRAYDIRVHGK
ncbi:MAG TPA: ABC transporter permease, partial [Quisquiliibacterium sp.]|jgi:peptide/nickel transport system permease protein|nr:ABC transporter permease [Quisquiliibacterium sp.]HPA90429.1 ABC transporter permease [Quisquiliibacterium sp.]HQD83456.1 ABC transporter permease [Quisquiliibacterium sp.]HQN11950.1 ABC transporter permease [Quisquiliibacterium sp.]HQP68409.1 ABC transporter permease [Quisquiliibacterium sp.]